MSSDNHPQIKACGLCASITQESVELKGDMKKFMAHFLDIKEPNDSSSANSECLPGKICITCFQECNEAKNFKERCIKAFKKLRKINKIIPKSFILGMSTHEEGGTESNHINEDVTKRNMNEIASEKSNCDISRPPRSKAIERSSKDTNVLNKTENLKPELQIENCDSSIQKYLKNEPVVEISWNERQLGELSLKKCRVLIDLNEMSHIIDENIQLSPKSKKVVNTHHLNGKKSSFGRNIRKSRDTSTYSYETSSRKKSRLQDDVSLSDSILSSPLSLSPSSKAKIVQTNSTGKKLESVVLNNINSESVSKYNHTNSSLNSSISSPVLNLYGANATSTQRKSTKTSSNKDIPNTFNSVNNSSSNRLDISLNGSLSSSILNSSDLTNTISEEELAKRLSCASNTHLNSHARKSKYDARCRKRKSDNTLVVYESEKTESKTSIRSDPLGISSNEDLNEAYPSKGINIMGGGLSSIGKNN